MNGQNPYRNDPPLYGLIKFLAIIGIGTIFWLGLQIGIALAAAGVLGL